LGGFEAVGDKRREGKGTMRTLLLTTWSVATLMIAAQPGFTQSADELAAVRRDIEALKEAQTEIEKQLREIKSLLQARPMPAAPAKEAVVGVEDSPFKGQKNAKITLVEFTDYQ
jgi:protein-disulfide isomerase